MNRIERLFARAFAATLLALGMLGSLEIGARTYILLAPDELFRKYATVAQLEARFGLPKFMPHTYLGMIPRPNWSRGTDAHNSHGFRGAEFPRAKPAGEFRIACLGGSTTHGTGVEAWRESYPAQLERRLAEKYASVRVINSGVPDWTTWQTLFNFQTRLLDFSPDLVIVYHAINDFETRIVWPPEAYLPDNSGSRAVREVAEPRLAERSAALRLLLIPLGRMRAPSRLDRSIERPKSWLIGPLRAQLDAGSYPAPPFDALPLEKVLAANPPRFFRRNLEHLVAIARLRGVQVVLTTMAVAPVEAKLRFGSRLDALGIGEMNDVTRAIAREYGLPLLDLASEYPQDASLFADGVHLNSRGSVVHAQRVARFLEASPLLANAGRQPQDPER